MALEALSSTEEVAEDVLLAALLRPEEVEGVELGLGLPQDGGLNPQGRVGPVELDPGQLGRLDVATELGRGVESALRVLKQEKRFYYLVQRSDCYSPRSVRSRSEPRCRHRRCFHR